MWGYLSPALPKKATVLVALDNRKKCFQRFDFKVWLIAVPLEVSLHPKDFPVILATNERRLGNR